MGGGRGRAFGGWSGRVWGRAWKSTIVGRGWGHGTGLHGRGHKSLFADGSDLHVAIATSIATSITHSTTTSITLSGTFGAIEMQSVKTFGFVNLDVG